jgi:hypothetical protein
LTTLCRYVDVSGLAGRLIARGSRSILLAESKMRFVMATLVVTMFSAGANAQSLGGQILKGAVKAAVANQAAKAAPKAAPRAVTVRDAKNALAHSNARETGKCLLDRRLPDPYGPVKQCDMGKEARKKKDF